ncbi:hypothetical protein ABEP17_14235 [Priestia flexa]|uniref:hypothetical protein n=1 Tax=Priestia flexa TaxID=86664 RepID=UPI003D2E1A45
MNLLKHHLLEKREFMKQIELLQSENHQLKKQYVETARKLKRFKNKCKELERRLGN